MRSLQLPFPFFEILFSEIISAHLTVEASGGYPRMIRSFPDTPTMLSQDPAQIFFLCMLNHRITILAVQCGARNRSTRRACRSKDAHRIDVDTPTERHGHTVKHGRWIVAAQNDLPAIVSSYACEMGRCGSHERVAFSREPGVLYPLPERDRARSCE